MLLILDDVHKDHLQFLKSLPNEVVKEFLRISIQFIINGSNPKVYQVAAQKLSVTSECVSHGVQGLMYLLIESSKLMLNAEDFLQSINALDFSTELCEDIVQTYNENSQEIRTVLSQMSLPMPSYRDLEWRFDIQLASRSLNEQITPQVLMKLHLADGDKQTTHILQTDPVNLLHLTQTLQTALNELRSSHCRRILRNI